ncbi:MAG: DegT/DnrJ/EryC1/StrS family aminotransferase [Candidatus Latescibacteria bacterium]|nr:DegT/DnrJ/EryC1/StrS family aminotransferase [Candidatus Latescibacterota bacterium]
MDKGKKAKSDFRYATGDVKVPWAAIGENVNADDVTEIVKFLIPNGKNQAAYDRQLTRVREEIEKLREKGGYATKLSLGNRVKELEEEVKEFLGVKYACFVTNATAGFGIGLKFSGLKPGDEMIAPAITFCSTISPALEMRAKVVLADIDPRTLNIDPEDVARKITSKTKVIMSVYIGGYPPDMDAIMKLARENDIAVVEDAAHAFGGSYKGKMSGTIGHFGSYSFHEVKNVNALGEGGIVVTNEPCGEDFPKARFVGFDIAHPIEKWLYDVVALKGKGGHYSAAGNHSSTEIQAAVLLNQMKRLKEIIAVRRENAEYLNKRFEGVEGIVPCPLDTDDIKSTYHLYLFQLDPDRLRGNIQDFKKGLGEKGVTQVPHFAPLYRFSYMKQLGYDTEAIRKTCPNAEEVFLHRFTHLPLYPLTQQQLEYMADSVIEVVKEMIK